MANESYIAGWMSKVSEAAMSFESRWTMRALRRVSADMHEAMTDQLALYHEALVTGQKREVDEHAAATIRGYVAVTGVMQAAGEPDDAYVLGFDARTGTRIAIGDQKACIARVREVHGAKVVWITADECAALFAQVEGFKTISAIKNLFPGTEIVDKYPNEPAKADALIGG